jgi:hypothetical protein
MLNLVMPTFEDSFTKVTSEVHALAIDHEMIF